MVEVDRTPSPCPWSRQTRIRTTTIHTLYSPFSRILINKVNCIYHLPSSHLYLPIGQPTSIPIPSPTANPSDAMPLFRPRQRNQVYQQQRPVQNRNYCCEGHMIIGFILSFVAALLLYVHLPASASLLDSDSNNGLIRVAH